MNKPKLHANDYLVDCYQEAWLLCKPINEAVSADPTVTPRVLEDVLFGVSHLGSTSSVGQPKLNPNLLFGLIASLRIISTEAVAEFLGSAYGQTSIKNYTLGARLASKTLQRLVSSVNIVDPELE
jgi:hypothetical protein